ncbi:MAG: WXG100 family type VII secretion target [Anaerolineae bacterium]|nr:WXG100 family type VII secretion target [Anaerolineae bacterium]
MPDVQLDYALMEEMQSVFQDSVQTLEDVQGAMQSIASTLEDGALLGQGGEALVDAIASVLNPALAKLQEKFEELVQDIAGAIQEFQEYDQTAASGFND